MGTADKVVAWSAKPIASICHGVHLPCNKGWVHFINRLVSGSMATPMSTVPKAFVLILSSVLQKQNLVVNQTFYWLYF